jgi:hypothetical protein
MAEYPGANTEYVYWLAPTCAAGTAVSAYTVTSAPGLATVFLWSWNVRIPPGHSGFTGIALVDSNSFVIPYSQGSASWLIGDDDDLTFPYGKQLGANVVVATYNTGTFNHAWQLRFVYTPMTDLDEGGAGEITVPDLTAWLGEIGSTGE